MAAGHGDRRSRRGRSAGAGWWRRRLRWGGAGWWPGARRASPAGWLDRWRPRPAGRVSRGRNRPVGRRRPTRSLCARRGSDALPVSSRRDSRRSSRSGRVRRRWGVWLAGRGPGAAMRFECYHVGQAGRPQGEVPVLADGVGAVGDHRPAAEARLLPADRESSGQLRFRT